MPLKRRQRQPSPELNLVPMLDVLMTVLTFFIVVSMTLAIEKGVEVRLPSNQPQPDTTPQPDAPPPLLIKMTTAGILVNDKPTPRETIPSAVKSYLAASEKGAAVLLADPDVPYEDFVNVLIELRQVGGDRVSISIDNPTPSPSPASPSPASPSPPQP